MKMYKCIRDLQLGENENPENGFCYGVCQSAEDWGKTASNWCDSDGWENPSQWLIKNWQDEQALIDAIQDCWDIVIVDVDSDGKDVAALSGLLNSHVYNTECKNSYAMNLWDVERRIRRIMYRNNLTTYEDKFHGIRAKLGRHGKLEIEKMD